MRQYYLMENEEEVIKVPLNKWKHYRVLGYQFVSPAREAELTEEAKKLAVDESLAQMEAKKSDKDAPKASKKTSKKKTSKKASKK